MQNTTMIIAAIATMAMTAGDTMIFECCGTLPSLFPPVFVEPVGIDEVPDVGENRPDERAELLFLSGLFDPPLLPLGPPCLTPCAPIGALLLEGVEGLSTLDAVD